MPANNFKPADRHREPAVAMQPVVEPGCWYADAVSGSENWIYTLSDAEIAAIEGAAEAAEARGADIKDITRADFALPQMADALAALKLMWGRGFVLIRGLPVDGRSRARIAAAFWGVSTHLGTAVSQNAEGHLLGHVKDIGKDYAKVRGYMSNAHMGFHNDQCDILALLCLHPAKSGGDHRICSSVALYNEMLARRPDLAKEMLWKFYRSRSGEIPPGETNPWLRQSAFYFHEGNFLGRGVSAAIQKAQSIPGVPKLTPAQLEAIAMWKSLAAELSVGIEFQKGDMFFLQNHVTLHSRGEYEDWPEPERKRHLLRLWLTNRGERPLPPEVDSNNQGITVPGTVLCAPLDVV
jgi:hypothetical protein